MPKTPDTGSITVRLSLDARPLKRLERSMKAAGARCDDIARPERAEDIQRLTDPSTVVRKALGEFDA